MIKNIVPKLGVCSNGKGNISYLSTLLMKTCVCSPMSRRAGGESASAAD